uniref:Uncharacterized protein n=1 Tax=Triticum urartu TaxID=4572 RepID=A0A8R7VA37_TRIUA
MNRQTSSGQRQSFSCHNKICESWLLLSHSLTHPKTCYFHLASSYQVFLFLPVSILNSMLCNYHMAIILTFDRIISLVCLF